jgi:hypothetical protein
VRRSLAGALLVVPVLALALAACIPVPPVTRVVTYSVATDGAVVSDVNQFAAFAQGVYDNQQGWRRAGIQFVRVSSGGDFTLVLANPAEIPKYDPVCSYLWSCTVGRNVVINDYRFANGSLAWPGPLDWYRTMVINHETGHWLGLGHAYCPGPGAPAPIMQQQSIDLQGCAMNSWPQPWELDLVR